MQAQPYGAQRVRGLRCCRCALPAAILLLTPEALATAGNGPRGSNEMVVAMLIVLGIVLMAVMLAFSMRSKVARRQAEQPTPRERIDSIMARAESRGRSEGISAESLDTAQSIATRLDNKAARLELLIEEAEARITQLEGAIEAARRIGAPLEQAPGHPRDEPAPASPPVAEPLDPLSRSIYELADSGRTSVEIARQLDEQVGKVELILALRRDRSTR